MASPANWGEPNFTDEDLNVRTRWDRIPKLLSQGATAWLLKHVLTGRWVDPEIDDVDQDGQNPGHSFAAAKAFMLSNIEMPSDDTSSC